MENWYSCASCYKEIEEHQIEYFCDDSDTAWCSPDCIQNAEDLGMQRYDSYIEEYEG